MHGRDVLMKTYLVLGGLLAVLVLSAALLSAVIRAQSSLPPQPIDFNHRLHLERVQGIKCEDCHRFATTQPFAGLPSKHVCFECHDPNPGGDAGEEEVKKFASLMAFADTSGDIPWHRVTALREDVFFSHRRHVTVGKIDCRRCHPDMPELTSPPTRGPTQMSMSTCIECHEEAKSSVDCISCHL